MKWGILRREMGSEKNKRKLFCLSSPNDGTVTAERYFQFCPNTLHSSLSAAIVSLLQISFWREFQAPTLQWHFSCLYEEFSPAQLFRESFQRNLLLDCGISEIGHFSFSSFIRKSSQLYLTIEWMRPWKPPVGYIIVNLLPDIIKHFFRENSTWIANLRAEQQRKKREKSKLESIEKLLKNHKNKPFMGWESELIDALRAIFCFSEANNNWEKVGNNILGVKRRDFHPSSVDDDAFNNSNSNQSSLARLIPEHTRLLPHHPLLPLHDYRKFIHKRMPCTSKRDTSSTRKKRRE